MAYGGWYLFTHLEPTITTSPPSSDLVADVLGTDPVFDGHNDLLWEVRVQAAYDFDRLDLAVDVPTTRTDIPRLRAGGVGAQFWSVFVPSTYSGDQAVAATLEQIDGVHRMIGTYADTFGLARTAEEVAAQMRAGRIASLLGAEGGHSIGCSLAVLRLMYVLGVRYLTLTHNDNVPWADSATDEPAAGGLSAFGVEVVREMNRLGMLVDLAHVADSTMNDALDTSSAPVLFSHSSARAQCDSPRNVPDDVLAKMAAGGGVCMVTFVPEFLSPDVAAWRAEAAEAAGQVGIRASDFERFQQFCAVYQQTHPKPEADIADVVRHVEHIRAAAGVDHVGLGGDYDGTDTFPVGMRDVTGYPRLLEALAERHWSRSELAALTSGNALRVMRDAEAVARDLQSTRAPSVATYAALDARTDPTRA